MALVARRLAIEFADPDMRAKAACGITLRPWCANYPGYIQFGNTSPAYATLRDAVAKWSGIAKVAAPSKPAGGEVGEESRDEDDLIGDCSATGNAGRTARLRWCVQQCRGRRDAGGLGLKNGGRV